MNAENDHRVLIMTACIKMEKKAERDVDQPHIRLAQYLKAMDFYIEYSSLKRIVFCDNSDFEYDYKEICKKAESRNVKLEILRFKGRGELAIEKGKGYGEGEIIDYVLKNSILINDSDILVKVTGRYIIRNMERILQNCKNETIYFNLSGMGLPYINTSFYVVPNRFYKQHLKDVFYSVDDKRHHPLEWCFFRELHKEEVVFKCFKRYPYIIGIGGTSGQKLQENIIKYYIKNFLCFSGLYNKIIEKSLRNNERGHEDV